MRGFGDVIFSVKSEALVSKKASLFTENIFRDFLQITLPLRTQIIHRNSIPIQKNVCVPEKSQSQGKNERDFLYLCKK
jgi:hypothetical protein